MSTSDTYFNPLTIDHSRDPYPFLDRLRADAPVYWHNELESWLVTTHKECLQVLGDNVTFCSDRAKIGVEIPEALKSIQTIDPPDHTDIREWLIRALHAQDYSALAAKLTAMTEARLADLADRHKFDVMQDLARPVASDAIFLLLGAPKPEDSWLAGQTQKIVASMDFALRPSAAEPGARARAALTEYMNDLLAHAPSAGGLLAYIRRYAPQLSKTDATFVENSFRVLLVAGYESLGRFLGLSVEAVMTNGLLEQCGTAVPRRAVDELLRYCSLVQAESRVCVADCRVGSRQVAAGDTVILLLGAANHDPAVFETPYALDLTRYPNPHLGFGRGPHACIGARLSVLCTQVLLKAIAQRVPELQCTAPATFLRDGVLRGIATLTVAPAASPSTLTV